MEHKSILIIGNGGREHALAWKLAQSPRVNQLFVAPGNAGTEQIHKTQNVDIAITDVNALIHFAKKNQVDFIVVGPEAALATGISDAASTVGIPCLGPCREAAQLETSKAFSKAFMVKHGIPTAAYAEFNQLDEALNYIQNHAYPLVIKADGLAAGKGVIIADNKDIAAVALADMLQNNRFGQAGQKVVIEEFLEGEELSFIALCDGYHISPLATSRDHKHRYEGDTGPNTGGMGAYSPVPITHDLQEKILKNIMAPVIKGMSDAGTPYQGFLYAGLMLDKTGEVRVLEFNCRLGDPETQPLLMRLKTDLFDVIEATLSRRLDQITLDWDARSALTVVIAAAGYPGDYRKGDVIPGLTGHYPNDTFVFQAGTRRVGQEIQTDGGRVLGVTALGTDLKDAQKKAYNLCQELTWPGAGYRMDIGWRGISQ